MKLGLINRDRLLGVGVPVVEALDALVSRIRASWNLEHTEDGGHSNITADTIATGRLVFSDIITPESLVVQQVNNFNPEGIDKASLLRLGVLGAFSEVSITGLQVPLDAGGQVLDGRVLVVENNDSTATIALEHEHTASSPRNRFTVPHNPISESTGARTLIFPRSIAVLMYNASRARWVIHSRSNEEVVSYATCATSQNDYAPSDFRAARVVRLIPTAANLTISGFSSGSVPKPIKKTLVNEGVYAIDILHRSTSSVAANRINCPGGVRYRLHPRESIELYRELDDTWYILAKANQWIDVAHSGGNFTATAGTWTVEASDQVTLYYQIDGNKMTVAGTLVNTSLSSTPAALLVTIPNGRVSARTAFSILGYKDNGTQGSGFVRVTAGGTTLRLVKNLGETANWAASAHNSDFAFEITFMIYDSCATISELHTDVSHGDTAHADADHSDVAHVDVVHADTHNDAVHSDAFHSDIAHSDSHSDTAHSDTAHSDTAHSDVAHEDILHDDLHSDSFTDPGDPEHADLHFDAPHSDVAHSDVAHSDVSHSDVSFSDSHSDTAHADGAHADTPHSDTHSDTPHSDETHSDGGHADTPHADSAHQDVGFHCDISHADL